MVGALSFVASRMGVTGLLPFISSTFTDCHLSHLRGKRAAVDASCWLHRGAHACAADLAQGVATNRYLGYALRMINLLRSHGVEPVLVFDGGPLPMKARQAERRRALRESEVAKGRAFLAAGERAEAYAAFARAIRITPCMARELVVELRARRVAYVVAPYEADAQCTFLVREGFCDLAISVGTTPDCHCTPHSLCSVVQRSSLWVYRRTETFSLITAL